MMDAPESNRSRSSKRDVEERIDTRDSRIEDDERRDHSDKRKPRSNKSWKHNDEDSEEQDNKRSRNSGDRNDGRRKSGGSSRAGSGDEDDYDTRRDSRSKIPRKDLEERGELRLSEGYRDRDFDSSRKGRDDEHELNSSKKTSTRPSGHESSQSRTRSRAESYHEGEREKVQDKESRSSDRKESSREKGHEHHEEERNPPHRRSDEADPGRTAGEISYVDRYDPKNGKSSDNDKLETTRERTHDSRNEYGEAKSRVLDSSGEKDIRSTYREERKVTDSKEKDVRSSTIEEKMADGERFRNWGRSEAHDEHSKAIAEPREARPDTVRDDRQRKVRERSVGLVDDADPSAHGYSVKSPVKNGEKHRQQRGPACGSRDEVDSKERSVNIDEDGHTWMRDRSEREVRRNRRSRTPERSGRHHRELDEHDRGAAEYEKERGMGAKSKEWEQNYKDERSSKGKDRSWSDKNREREGSKDHRKIIQFRHDAKDVDKELDDIKECDSQKCEQERTDSEKLHSRPGYRKDSRIRPEGVKASLSLGNINEQSDSIEIKLKNSNFVREESVSTFSGRRTEVGSQQDFASGAGDEEWGYPAEDRGTMTYNCGDDLQERLQDEGSPVDQNPSRNSLDSLGANARGQKRGLNSGSQPPFGTNQGSGSFNRVLQGPKGGRPARGGRRMSGRDAQRVGIPLPMMGPPFGHLGLPPAPMQPLGPTMSPGPSIGPGVLIPPFPGPLVWQGARGVDMNMVPVPPNLPSFPPSGPVGPRFAPNMGSSPNHPMYFNQPGTGRGAPPYTSGPGFSVNGPIGRETPHDKAPMNWGPPRNSGPSGKAPSRGEQNDYSQNFVDSGMRPQNFIRELELTNVVEDYPKLRELIQRKDEIVAKSASPPMYYKCDLHEFVLSAEFFGTKFDVILVDPPWEEYVHRVPGVTDHLEYWSFEEIQNLKIEAIADNPSFIFLWVGDGAGLEQGRQCLKKWGFRRCEDICWVKTNKRNATPGLRHDSRTLFQHSKEHCLMGIKGTVRRSTDGHIIHANIDTDIIIAEEPSDGSTKKPEDMYRIIEHFSLGRRRLELFGEDHNIRSGWLTVGKGLSSSNFNTEAYIRNFADKDGKVWQGSGGRNPPPDAPHLVLTTPEIESLRPKSPPPKNQQQQQSMSLMTTGSSNSRRPSGNSPQTNLLTSQSGLNQEGSVSEPGTPSPWVGLRGGLESGHGISDDKLYEGYGFSTSCMQGVGDHHEFDPHRAVNMM